MKRNTAYFIIGGVALLFLVGIFIYISASTYSVFDIADISIDDVNVPINGTKNIDVSFEFNNNNETIENIDDYRLEWEVNPSSSVTLESSTTNLQNPNNSITALSIVPDVTVTVKLYRDNEVIVSDSASVNIFDIEDVSFTNVSDASSFSINISNKSVRMLLPSKYSSNRVDWDSSDKTVLTVGATGLINPVSSGNSTVSATIYDDENNVIALATQVVMITRNVNDDISGDSEDDDYSLTSISINGQANILEGTNKDYIVTLSNATSFKVKAVAKNGGTVKIINGDDGTVYNNNDSIPWKIGSPTMDILVCAVNDQNECVENYKYEILLQMDENVTVNREGYLESLTIGSDKIIENGVAIGNYVVNCDDESDDDVFLCKVEYTTKPGVREININIKPKNKYAIGNADENPIILSEGSNSAYYTLVESDDSIEVARCLYEIIITVPASSDGNTNKPDVTRTGSPNATSNPGTADMSSFIIFMIMLVSLIASLFVYKKNVGNN